MRTATIDPRAGMGGAPVPGRIPIRSAGIHDAATIARTLAAAFFDDPWAVYCSPRESTRLRKWEVGFELYLRRIWLRHGTTLTTQQGDGAAVWLPPGAAIPSAADQLRALPRIVANGGLETLHLFRSLAAFERVHPSEPHYYLPLVGVLPERQRRGIGQALLQPVLERCDREGLPAYLEATNERCIALYERNGFEVLDELRLPKGGPPWWPMRREPGHTR